MNDEIVSVRTRWAIARSLGVASVRVWMLGALIASTSLRAETNDSPIVTAAKSHELAAVRALITRRADINAPGGDGMTALHWAVRNGDAAIVQALIAAGARVKEATRYGVTPLHLAATNADPRLASMLLRAGADPNAALAGGPTPLMSAARSGNPEVIRLLVARGANVNVREKTLDETAVMWAAAENHGPAVAVLAELGADLNARSARTIFPQQQFTTSGMVTTYLNKGEWTALMFAARENAQDALRSLIAARVNLDLRDGDGSNALSIALVNRHYDAAALLIEAGADANVVDESGVGALYNTVHMHNFAGSFGRPFPAPDDARGPVDIARMLLERGANPNLQNTKAPLGWHHIGADNANGAGTTPLMRATTSGDMEMVRLLLDHGADVKLAKPDGTTVLFLASAGGGRGGVPGLGGNTGSLTPALAVTAAKLFIGKGADVNTPNMAGQTPLHLAARNGQDDLVRAFVDAGAKLDAKDNQGLMPIDYAMGRGTGARGRGPGGGGPGGAPAVRQTTVALLGELMTAKGLAVPPLPQPSAQ